MDQTFKNQLLDAAISIGEGLLNIAEEDENGMSWKNMRIDSEKEVKFIKSESIYSGVSGIVLFFLELYRQTNNEKYLQTAIKGGNWIEHHSKTNPTAYYAFFTGRMSATYLMLQLAKVTGDDTYRQKALTIARDCETFIEGSSGIDDLINGTSGALLGLLHLHQATGEDWVAKAIQKLALHLIKKANPGPIGLYWDRSSNNIRGLCGFSHGASGVGYVFMELAHYTGNEAFYWVAKQALAYENHLYREDRGNWPDFRKGVYDEDSYNEHKTAYLKNDISFFTTPGDMSAWCHGAPGIGLSRVRAYELFKDDQYAQDLEKAIAKTKRVSVDHEEIRGSYTLCHGAGGNAMLFLEAYKRTPDAKYLEMAYKVGQKALDYIKKYPTYISGYASRGDQEDTSLYMGNAGIGYFYLYLIDPENTPSVLMANVEQPSNVAINGVSDMPLQSVLETIMAKVIPRTLQLYKKMMGKALVASLPAPHPFNMDNAITHVGEIIKESNQDRLNEIYQLESKRWQMDNAFTSDAYKFIRTAIESNKSSELLKDIDDVTFNTLKLALPKEVATVTTTWDWEESLENQEWISREKPEEEAYLLLTATAEGIQEFALNQFAYVVISLFENPKTIESAMEELKATFEIDSEEELGMLDKAFKNQIKETMNSGFLVIQEPVATHS